MINYVDTIAKVSAPIKEGLTNTEKGFLSYFIVANIIYIIVFIGIKLMKKYNEDLYRAYLKNDLNTGAMVFGIVFVIVYDVVYLIYQFSKAVYGLL